ncbi:ras-related protein rab- hypothetical protein [Limosa lapponica baueri]|uniref:small monomeric GTPase n=1 Tax=Limosa lapponica baueri TaxID=1758121 RepID=A0A2I0U895_LIMLA|nr:ras-related protein rab- hypothetical protein [Limosa lapponica baueri]
MKKAGDEVDVVLLGNKCDKESERVVPKQKGEKLAWEHGIPFFETSAKDNVNIEDAFSILTKEILEKGHPVAVDVQRRNVEENGRRREQQKRGTASPPDLTLAGDIEMDRVTSCHSSKHIVNPTSKVMKTIKIPRTGARVGEADLVWHW